MTNRLDFGFLKSVRIREGHTFQIHANFFNATNTRDWGIPEGTFTSPAFLNEGATEVPPRRIQLGCAIRSDARGDEFRGGTGYCQVRQISPPRVLQFRFEPR